MSDRLAEVEEVIYAQPPPTQVVRETGIHMSGFWAGIFSALLILFATGSFTNLWYLNKQITELNYFRELLERPGASLPGAMSRAEWESNRKLITQEMATQYGELNAKIGANSAVLTQMADDVRWLARAERRRGEDSDAVPR